MGFINIGEIIGIAKAYTTRVGEGPFPTELKDKTGDLFQKKGKEFGATTGRPRRCGWLDLMILKRAKKLNNINKLVITKLDILDVFENIKMAVSYKQGGKDCEVFPYDLSQVEPCYSQVKGWQEDIANIRKWDDLPKLAKQYVEKMSEYIDCPVGYISVGEKRDAIIGKK